MLPEHVLLIDKPKGPTSFDVIRKLRRTLGIKKMGHAGTLDPLASGLMIVGVQEGTKLLADYLKLPKTYEAEIVLGEKRTTGDLEGEVTESCDVYTVDETHLRDVLATMVGTLALAVPAYSAVKQGGVPLYKKARRGEKVQTPVKQMTITRAELTHMAAMENRVHVHVVFDVESGTYIRSLAEELGQRLNLPATLGNLRRTRVGPFSVADARTL